MIYSFNIITDERTTKKFYMTADNHNQLYMVLLKTMLLFLKNMKKQMIGNIS